MGEVHVKEFQEREGERQQRLADLKKKTVEERLDLLEAEVLTEDDRLYNVVLPEIDEQINRAIAQSYETDDKAQARVEAGVEKVQAVERSIQATLTKTVNELIAKSSSEVVAKALSQALKSTVLITRNATRSDDPSNVLVVRSAPAASRS